MTLLEERYRMARELHDSIGHTFTSIILGMEHYVLISLLKRGLKDCSLFFNLVAQGSKISESKFIRWTLWRRIPLWIYPC
ncbi:histidine kinase dimerization/phosphoacceptor domain-containing protein [Paenibacillus polymyxa]|uniref:histidine kinase n=1 Tax=Paenibacillus polymyxa TaxID=1406 RepID=UPI003D2A8EB3